MSTTPGKPTRPRQSGIPTPGKTSGIPAPGGRSRSTSSATDHGTAFAPDVEYVSRAFADAIKSNDPAQHRSSRTSDISNASLSPRALTSQSGRRSVTGRPASSASSSSIASLAQSTRAPTRPKTPSGRPASRQSDTFGRSASRLSRTFEVGDNVRIESLGYEGTLRYVGDIEGKPGVWAGVELSGGFAGKGKNNGVVSGKQYFTCPPKCGVFVATSKLSPPTVGPGAIIRPSSVASSRSGRATPSFSGRVTPSASTSFSTGRATPSTNGRVTPSYGRVTPSRSTGRVATSITPSARARTGNSAKPAPLGGASAHQDKRFTAGSRASKYLGLTAKELDSRDVDSHHALHSPPTSPSHGSMALSSPTRLVSPFSTPKPGPSGRMSNIGVGTPSSTPSKGRPAYNTPRARIPSAIAMPPPASPAGARSVSLNERPSRDLDGDPQSDLEANGKALQDKISLLMSGKSSPARSSRPESATSMRSTPDQHALLSVLQSRIDALDYENQRLRVTVDSQAGEHAEVTKHVEALQVERDDALSRIADLEGRYKTAERSLNERDSRIDALDRAAQQAATEAEQRRAEADNRLKDLQSKLDDSTALINNLKEALDAKEGMENQNDAVLKAKNAEISLLQARVDKVSADFLDERRELGAQVEELREAGQETIALYEERLSAADTQRYELEDRISALEARLRKESSSTSAGDISQLASSAAQIDNEALRDQVQHLQKRITILEDTLEDVQATSEREETAARERIRRLKEKDDAMKKELTEGRNEVDRMAKAEASARRRLEEVEEAFRESALALENSRAEIEGLRTDLANLDGKMASSGSSDRLAEATRRSATERTQFLDEIAKLKEALDEARVSKRDAAEQLDNARSDAQEANRSLNELRQAVESLEEEKALLHQQNADRLTKLDHERTELSRALEERAAELDSLKKKANRDVGIQDPFSSSTSISTSPTTSKHDPAVKEEMAGLKHIVQDLQKENTACTQRIKILESENRLLVSETDQLRQELKVLEDNIDQSILREENALANGFADSTSSSNDDIATLKREFREQKAKLELEIEQLRKRLSEMEIKSARTVHDLNKEINELESLIESKIYREDELEQELERAKDKLARQKKSSKNGIETNDARPRGSSTASTSSASTVGEPAQDVCEICERPGHDIFNCDLLRDDATMLPRPDKANDPSSLFCEDCESHGHSAEDCPHSLDVF
ncbi:hypothetical protein PLICRDRAFT_172397 [Plicaturopsis crispa FD-325 SS-3]|nr:hypothetical protein PLICRDRAFT_172397 [Plicaturopsis crispa FD-325 SS-3]